jgi:hypothetical protein
MSHGASEYNQPRSVEYNRTEGKRDECKSIEETAVRKNKKRLMNIEDGNKERNRTRVEG